MALPPNPGEGPQLHEVRLTWLAWDASAFWCGAGKRSELVSCVCAVALSCTRQSQHKQGTAMASIHMHRRILRTALAFGAAALLVSALLFAASPVNTLKGGLFGGHSDTAILGYDTVAYFTLSKAVKGQDRFVYEWMGAKWRSEEHTSELQS